MTLTDRGTQFNIYTRISGPIAGTKKELAAIWVVSKLEGICIRTKERWNYEKQIFISICSMDVSFLLSSPRHLLPNCFELLPIAGNLSRDNRWLWTQPRLVPFGNRLFSNFWMLSTIFPIEFSEDLFFQMSSLKVCLAKCLLQVANTRRIGCFRLLNGECFHLSCLLFIKEN